MTGYDKSPDYGGPPFSWRIVFVTATIIFVVAASLVWAAL
jgi:hypothetical protein